MDHTGTTPSQGSEEAVETESLPVTRPGSVGCVETKSLRLDGPVELTSGRSLPEIQIAYETYGQLNAARSNAVLICHALSGDAHVAGYHPDENPDEPGVKPGWWDDFVGPGKAVDTDRYFVICSNVLGGCKGTTGPSSINPDTDKPYGLSFPLITIGDMVEVQKHLIDHMGIGQLLCVIGGSMGGMQALEWAVRYPDRLRGVIPVATTPSLTAQSLAFDAVGRNAILSDPNFHGGHYHAHGENPAAGLGIARMLGHITYLSEESMHLKFGRKLRYAQQYAYDFKSEFSVETYLDYQGDKFVGRFDANTYLYLTRAMDYFDLGADRGGLHQALAQTKARFLVVSFRSDWLFSPEQSLEVVQALSREGRPVSYVNIDSPFGHDAFLLEPEVLGRLVRGFLSHLERHDEPGARPAVEIKVEPEDRERLDLRRIEQLIDSSRSVLDLGCGTGLLLKQLQGRVEDRAQGVEIDQEAILGCVDRGVDVIHADLDKPLDMFTDKVFDWVVLSRTMQTVRHPTVVLREMLRIGRRCIVSFPNFGYWRNRVYLSVAGRAPVSRNLPFSWIDTPNLHHLSLLDFEEWCRQEGVRIEQRIPIDYQSEREIKWLPYLRATDAIYVLSQD